MIKHKKFVFHKYADKKDYENKAIKIIFSTLFLFLLPIAFGIYQSINGFLSISSLLIICGVGIYIGTKINYLISIKKDCKYGYGKQSNADIEKENIKNLQKKEKKLKLKGMWGKAKHGYHKYGGIIAVAWFILVGVLGVLSAKHNTNTILQITLNIMVFGGLIILFALYLGQILIVVVKLILRKNEYITSKKSKKNDSVDDKEQVIDRDSPLFNTLGQFSKKENKIRILVGLLFIIVGCVGLFFASPVADGYQKISANVIDVYNINSHKEYLQEFQKAYDNRISKDDSILLFEYDFNGEKLHKIIECNHYSESHYSSIEIIVNSNNGVFYDTYFSRLQVVVVFVGLIVAGVVFVILTLARASLSSSIIRFLLVLLATSFTFTSWSFSLIDTLNTFAITIACLVITYVLVSVINLSLIHKLMPKDLNKMGKFMTR
jgi:hypothetical protein